MFADFSSHEFNDPSMTTSNASASAVKVRKAPDLPMPPDLEKLMGKFACAIIANLFGVDYHKLLQFALIFFYQSRTSSRSWRS